MIKPLENHELGLIWRGGRDSVKEEVKNRLRRDSRPGGRSAVVDIRIW